ncbi:hypothetical protein N431DRAFT_477777 [Stipitochalara longipes BDJ]|nr:hypothetical protein N431DRAFT_477777 [Stipitochalara longipes BDJ]
MRFQTILSASMLSLAIAQESPPLISYFEAVEIQSDFMSANSVVKTNSAAAAAESKFELSLEGGATTLDVNAVLTALPTQVTAIFASVLSEVVILAPEFPTVTTSVSNSTLTGSVASTATRSLSSANITFTGASSSRWAGFSATVVAGVFVATLVAL